MKTVGYLNKFNHNSLVEIIDAGQNRRLFWGTVQELDQNTVKWLNRTTTITEINPFLASTGPDQLSAAVQIRVIFTEK